MNVYWLEQREIDVPLSDDWLSDNERVRLGALRFAKRRADWRLGRWTAKRAVAAYLNLPPSFALTEIEIRTAPSGAPQVFVAQRPAELSISLTHSSGTAACAVSASDSVLGCDLETIAPRSNAFINDYFTEQEQTFVANAPVIDRPCLVNLIWSAKESALKALQEGLRLDTRSVIVTLLNWNSRLGNGWYPLRVRAGGGQPFHGWYQCASHDLVRTLVAVPQPVASAPPILLRPSRCTDHESYHGSHCFL
jgi:4'-phosphopantetheinyl transferase